ncbi:MAG: sodium:solute symporter family protein [Moorellaceae bacterium]
MQVKAVPLAITLVYLVAIAAIGAYFWRRAGKDEDHYYVAGRSIGSFFAGLAFTSDMLSQGIFAAGVGAAYSFGGIGLCQWNLWFGPATMLLLAYLIAPRLRAEGFTSFPEYFERIGGSRVLRGISAVVVAVAMVGYLVVETKAIGMVGEYVLGVPYATSTLLFGGCLLLYTVLGGMLSSIWSGVIQAVLILLTSGAVALAGIRRAGGFSELVGVVAEKFPWFLTMEGQAGIIYPITFALMTTSIVLAAPHLIMRVFATRSPAEARRTILWGLFFERMFWACMIVVMLAIGAHVMPVDNPDMGFILVMDKVFSSPVMIGIGLAAMLAASMSTTSVQLLAGSAALAHDLYTHLIKKDADVVQPGTLATRGRIASAIIGLVALYLTLNPPPLIINMLTLVGAIIAACFLVPLYVSLFWRRVNKYAIGGAMAGGFVTVLVTHPLLNILPVHPDTLPVVLGVLASAAIMTVITLGCSWRGATTLNSPRT